MSDGFHDARSRGIVLTPEFQARFWAKVQKSEGCWEWTAARSSKGYGAICMHRGCIRGAHRISFLMANGFMAEVTCHHCDNPSCVRPDHLYNGTKRSNARDMVNRGRSNASKTHCKRGHEFTPGNTISYSSPNKSPMRGCRTCRINRRRAKRQLELLQIGEVV